MSVFSADGGMAPEGSVQGYPVMLPRWENSQLVRHAAPGTGNWIGAASALVHDDYIYLAHRDRHRSRREGATGPM
jgi:hypothetical protein